MRRKRQWQLWLISPFLLLSGLYLFLVGANYYYASRAEYLLRQIRDLKLENASIAELKRIGSEHGLRYDETPADSCIDVPCLYYVFTNNRWMHSVLKSTSLARFGERLGLRSWFAAGDIELLNGTVIGKVYGIQFCRGSDFPEVEISAWEESKLETSACAYYPIKRHPGYAFSNASNIRSFKAETSDATSASNREHAFDLNLSCLTSWHKCEQFSELMPSAWADYSEDERWSETHHPTLPWKIGTPCPW